VAAAPSSGESGANSTPRFGDQRPCWAHRRMNASATNQYADRTSLPVARGSLGVVEYAALARGETLLLCPSRVPKTAQRSASGVLDHR
jgi:hypothetical protein